MTTADMDKIIDRIRKLHAKAESAKEIGSFEEAAAFAAAVEKMLMKYKLSQSTLTFDEKEAEDPLGAHWLNWDKQEGMKTNKRRINWISALTMTVAEAHFCKLVFSRKSSNIIIFGREQDRAVCEYMCVMLVRLGIDLADKAYRKKRYETWKKGRLEEAHGFREAFLFGYVTRLEERYAAMRAEEVKLHGPGVAIVVQRSSEEVEKYRDSQMDVQQKTTKIKADHREGIDQGRAAAEKVNLNGKGVGGSTQDPTSALTRGQRLLGGAQ